MVGFPALAAAAAMHQGRLASAHAFLQGTEGYQEQSSNAPTAPFPLRNLYHTGGVHRRRIRGNADQRTYSIRNRTCLLSRGRIARIMGDTEGILKLVFHRESLQLLGVHIIGERTAELIHLGQAIIAYGGTIDYFIENVVNYPTLSDAYKVASLNGVNRL